MLNIAWFYRNVSKAVLLELFKDKGLLEPVLHRKYFKTSTINTTANTEMEFIYVFQWNLRDLPLRSFDSGTAE